MSKYFLIICSFFVLCGSVFGQDTLEGDLSKSLKKYDLLKLDNNTVLEKAKSEQPLVIQAYGRYFEFVLTPNEIRAGNYKAVETTEAGDRELPREQIATFKGKLRDDYLSEVRFSVTGSGVEGLIYTSDDKKFFITKAERFSKRARKDEAVIFAEEDLIKNVDLSDDALHVPRDNGGKSESSFELLKSYIFGSSETAEPSAIPAPETAAALADLKIIEVATEADNQWVSQAGGAAQANNEILGILNLVDGIYRRDLNLSITVTYQHAWTTVDPYPATGMETTLNAFLAYWNTNSPRAQYPRDTAHLFTGKYSNAGLAYIGVICSSPTYAYGLSGRSGSVNHLITAHEIGHNLNADHVDAAQSCANSIMNPVLTPSATSFCAYSKNQIATYVAANGSCLSSGGPSSTPTPTPTPPRTPTPTPTPTPPLNSSISGVVYYYSGQKPVPNVLISVQGTVSTSTYTDSSGSYAVSNLITGGVYTVTPYKTGAVNNITSFDATLVLRYVASGGSSASALSASQQRAADTDGDGTVSSFDATQMLRYVASNGASSGTGQIGTWRFTPSQRTYAPLLGSQYNQNYEAVLVGEVTGDWSPQ